MESDLFGRRCFCQILRTGRYESNCADRGVLSPNKLALCGIYRMSDNAQAIHEASHIQRPGSKYKTGRVGG
jgi:hypothetical protein